VTFAVIFVNVTGFQLIGLDRVCIARRQLQHQTTDGHPPAERWPTSFDHNFIRHCYYYTVSQKSIPDIFNCNLKTLSDFNNFCYKYS